MLPNTGKNRLNILKGSYHICQKYIHCVSKKNWTATINMR